VQAGGNVAITVGLQFADVKQMIAEERETIVKRVWDWAKEMLAEAGIRPGPVPLRTLLPLLQYASLENDEYLQERWAALLANAGRCEDSELLPSFVEILRQLSPLEAHLLDRMYSRVIDERSSTPGTVPERIMVGNARQFMAELPNHELRVRTALANLGRIGLISGSPGAEMTPLFFTLVGFGFVSACRRPTGKGLQQ
jgi:hypothetical protein